LDVTASVRLKNIVKIMRSDGANPINDSTPTVVRRFRVVCARMRSIGGAALKFH
jgi:hypothetical protein